MAVLSKHRRRRRAIHSLVWTEAPIPLCPSRAREKPLKERVCVCVYEYMKEHFESGFPVRLYTKCTCTICSPDIEIKCCALLPTPSFNKLSHDKLFKSSAF